MKNIVRAFTRSGKRYFIPSNSRWAWRTLEEGWRADEAGRIHWLELKQRILSRWEPCPAFKTFSRAGHIAALRPHVPHQWFGVIDLLDFYDHVTRTKVHRSLESIGLGRDEAFSIAGNSTVRQGSKISLARGFRQSSLLAALALDQSLFGSHLRRKLSQSTITIFSDDIIVSSDDRDDLSEDFLIFLDLLERSNFPVQPQKTQFPQSEVQVFNIKISHETMQFTDERMWKFLKIAKAIFGDNPDKDAELFERMFGGYVSSVNIEQARLLRESIGISSE